MRTQKFYVFLHGGIGPDVWDREVILSAVDWDDAYNQAKAKAEALGGQIGEISPQHACSNTQSLPLAATKAVFDQITRNLTADRDAAIKSSTEHFKSGVALAQQVNELHLANRELLQKLDAALGHLPLAEQAHAISDYRSQLERERDDAIAKLSGYQAKIASHEKAHIEMQRKCEENKKDKSLLDDLSKLVQAEEVTIRAYAGDLFVVNVSGSVNACGREDDTLRKALRRALDRWKEAQKNEQQ